MPPIPSAAGNHLITRLPVREQRALVKACETVELVFGQVLCEPGTPFRHLHFPLTGFISLVVEIDDHAPLEMGMIGHEGVLGVTVVLGTPLVPMRAIVQGNGTALRIAIKPFMQLLATSPALSKTLHRYLYVVLAQLSQIAACTHFHEVEQRLARWLLMSHDRAHGDHFHLTHQFLADMLGVRRSGISLAAGVMQARGLIRYARGDIEMLDRAGVERLSCVCYAEVVAHYALHFGRPPGPLPVA